jgi:hypothetical protein
VFGGQLVVSAAVGQVVHLTSVIQCKPLCESDTAGYLATLEGYQRLAFALRGALDGGYL